MLETLNYWLSVCCRGALLFKFNNRSGTNSFYIRQCKIQRHFIFRFMIYSVNTITFFINVHITILYVIPKNYGISDVCGDSVFEDSIIPWLPLTHELTSRINYKLCSDTLCMIDLIREKLTIHEKPL